MMPRLFSLLIFSCFLFGCGKAPDMPDFNKTSKVELLNYSDEKILFLLPLKGSVERNTKLWSGDYWALNQGNINLRWNALMPTGFDLVSPPLSVALMLT